MIFIGLVDISAKSFPLAFLAGATMFIQVRMTMPAPEPRKADAEPNLKEDFMRSMQMQMRYVMPVIIGVVAYTISAAIALYFVVSNLTMIAQEFIVRRHK